MAQLTTCVTIVLKNKNAVRALAIAKELIEEVAEDQPWNAELRKAAKAIRFAANNLKVDRQ